MAIERVGFLDAAGVILEVSNCELTPEYGSRFASPDQWCAIHKYSAWVRLSAEPGAPLRAADLGDQIKGTDDGPSAALRGGEGKIGIAPSSAKIIKSDKIDPADLEGLDEIVTP